MRIPADLEGCRLNVSRTAELIAMEAGHFRRLIKRGVFPAPKRTSKGMPYYDHELLCRIGGVLKSGVGVSGEEISFYRRKSKSSRQRTRRPNRQAPDVQDPYIASMIEGCRQLGVDGDMLDDTRIKVVLSAEFGDDRPELQEAIPVVARKLLAGE